MENRGATVVTSGSAKQHRSSRRALATGARAGRSTAAAHLALSAATPTAATAATLYWEPGASGTGTWTTATSTVNWASTNAAQAPDSFWTNGSTAFFFNPAVTATSYAVSLGSNISSAGVEFNTSAAVTVGGASTLNNGTGSLVVDGGAGAVTFSSNISGGRATATFGNLSLLNNSANGLTLGGAITTNGQTSMLTFGGTGTITLNGVVGGGSVAAEFKIIDNDTGNVTFTKATGNYGQVVVNAGTLEDNAAGANGYGTGSLKLGNASGGSLSATLQFNGTDSQANAITLGTTTGTLTIGAASFGVGTLSGAITGANNLTLGADQNGARLPLSGSVNPAGVLTLTTYGGNTNPTGGVTISGAIGSNVTGINVAGNAAQSNVLSNAANAYTGFTNVTSGAVTLGPTKPCLPPPCRSTSGPAARCT